MPAITQSARPTRSILKISVACTFVVVAGMVAAIFFFGAPAAEAATCTWTGGSGDWAVAANWGGGAPCGTVYPGQNPGDTASFLSSPTVTVTTVIPNAVILSVTGG